jgi:hypothetical protein
VAVLVVGRGARVILGQGAGDAGRGGFLADAEADEAADFAHAVQLDAAFVPILRRANDAELCNPRDPAGVSAL